jgi:hypothetical protein
MTRELTILWSWKEGSKNVFRSEGRSLGLTIRNRREDCSQQRTRPRLRSHGILGAGAAVQVSAETVANVFGAVKLAYDLGTFGYAYVNDCR